MKKKRKHARIRAPHATTEFINSGVFFFFKLKFESNLHRIFCKIFKNHSIYLSHQNRFDVSNNKNLTRKIDRNKCPSLFTRLIQFLLFLHTFYKMFGRAHKMK